MADPTAEHVGWRLLPGTRVASRDSSQRVQAQWQRLHPFHWDQLEAAFGKGACSGHTASAFSHRTAECRCVRVQSSIMAVESLGKVRVVLQSAPSITEVPSALTASVLDTPQRADGAL